MNFLEVVRLLADNGATVNVTDEVILFFNKLSLSLYT